MPLCSALDHEGQPGNTPSRACRASTDAMPTLFRLLFVLAILAGLAFGAMVALTIFVDPGVRETTVRIPARDLVQGAPRQSLADPAAPAGQ